MASSLACSRNSLLCYCLCMSIISSAVGPSRSKHASSVRSWALCWKLWGGLCQPQILSSIATSKSSKAVNSGRSSYRNLCGPLCWPRIEKALLKQSLGSAETYSEVESTCSDRNSYKQFRDEPWSPLSASSYYLLDLKPSCLKNGLSGRVCS